ncbi:hypothetical protein [Deinococcus soli (ex Cha et al. 2016)]|uniref:Uncharacterized protein n=2 Tax=Deinococcus soli (ex Cha et al. 2016) TaxID=1309411 RepID=A0ACC6KGH0_9DEIO|nr:hypothetical protein [Deinococcus soli (ex Cha et al. 2016)]MDR6218511.1 hypothetical protein [Deinococcus soli (ex Cha et al. 2016)]MDR6329251.1 hypothetical protein [Deinococcus soli (ex Cha et al. 2016)]MDR6751524.1 hypothetical protein [Deinococcus soli (ex Cha et al. 2016)]
MKFPQELVPLINAPTSAFTEDTPGLTDSEHAFILALRDRWGSRMFEDALADLGEASAVRLCLSGHLSLRRTEFGVATCLGPHGRVAAGLNSPGYRKSPNTIEDEVYLWHGIEYLAAQENFTYQGRASKALHTMQSRSGAVYYVTGRARGHYPQSVRRLIQPLRAELIRQGSQLIVFHPDLRRTRYLEEMARGLIRVIPMKGFWLKPTRGSAALQSTADTSLPAHEAP